MTAQAEIVLRPARWLLVVVALADAIFVAGLVTMYLLQGLSSTTLAFAGLCLVSAAGVVEASTRRVVLGADALHVANLWSRKAYSRTDIRSVSWAKGSPVSVQLADGRWVKLPEVGSSPQGAVNAIRAWLKRGGS